jgi:type II secretory pathway component PulF/putative methionine-R-sulfoxide reductase with GAF domain
MREALAKITGQIRTADRVVFLLQEGRQFSIKASHGGRPGRDLPVDRVSRAILRRVRRTGRTLFLSDAMADNGLGSRRSIQEIGQRSVICAPLKANGRVVGIVYADTVSMIAAFTPAHLTWINRMTESLNEQLEPLIPERMETMFDEHSIEPGDDPDSDLIVPSPVVARAAPTAFSSNADAVFAPDRTPLDPARSKAEKVRSRDQIQRKEALRLTDLATFYRGLASMLTAGITVHRALDVLGEQSYALAPVARSLHNDVLNGHRLSEGMARYPHVFSPVQRALIRVGEETGSLDILSLSLAEHVEGRMALKGKVVAALTYPVLVAGFCILGCLLAPPLFLNDFFETLKATGVKLPWLTKVVIGASNAIWSPLTWISLGALAAILSAVRRRLKASPRWALRLQRELLKIPVVGPVRQSFILLDFMQTLALQIEAGLRLDKSLLLSASVSGNAYLAEQTRWVVEHVKSGATLSYSLHRAKVFPRTVVEFVALGEETGKMSKSLRFAEALLRERAETALETAETLMEPLAICFVGALVGVVALASMLPLVRMFEAFV